MEAWARGVKENTRLRWNRINKFQPKINLVIEFGPYILKTANSYEELIESFKLRHAVFYQEFQGKKKTGLDFDRFDRHFDHLIIIHKDSNEIIGTYRLNCSEY